MPIHTLHVCLVSEQVPANLIPLLQDPPDEAHLVVSEPMRPVAERMKRIIEGRDCAVVLHGGAPSVSLNDVIEYATELIAELRTRQPNASIILNATGGTKLMALGFVEVFRDLDNQLEIIYTDTTHQHIEYLVPREKRAQAFGQVLDIPTYLAAYGVTFRSARSDDAAWGALANQRKAATKHLGMHAKALGSFIGTLNSLAQAALDETGESLRASMQRFNQPPGREWRTALTTLQAGQVLAYDPSSHAIIFKDAESARYAGGLWLEEYVCHMLADQGPHDIRLGVVGTWEGDRRRPARNEFDLIAVHGNRMLVVECKTLRFGRDDRRDSDVLYKLESLGRTAGGLFTERWLISARKVSDDLRERARSQHIALFDTARLPDLRKALLDWMKAGA